MTGPGNEHAAASSDDDWPASWGAKPAGWRDLVAVSGRIAGLGRAAVAGFALATVADLIGLTASLDAVGLVDRLAADPDAVTDAQLRDADDALARAAVAQIVATLAAYVTFVVWLYRAYRHAERRHAYTMRHSRGWVIGAWFVPLLNLLRPKQIVDDVWRASRVQRSDEPRVPAYVHFWWAAFVVSFVAGRISSAIERTAATLDDVSSASQLGVVSDAAGVVANLLAILLVVRLTANQRSWLTEPPGSR